MQKEEVDFRDLLRFPRKLFGFGYLYVLAVIAVLGILYAHRLTAIGHNEVLPRAADSVAAVQDVPAQAPRTIAPVNPLVAGVSTPEAIARGHEVYRANCVSCHGENGMGDGPAALTLNPKPRNFHLTEGWTNGIRFADLYKTLQEGIVRNGMASFNYLPPADRFAVIHYVRTFQQTPVPADSVELQRLETTYQLSKGGSTPGQIPLRAAGRVLSREDSTREATALRLRATIVEAAQADAVLRAVIADPGRVALVLASGRPPRSMEGVERAVAADPLALGFRSSVNTLSAAARATAFGRLQALAAAASRQEHP
jgi:mono/diheme cytochrome c family protein